VPSIYLANLAPGLGVEAVTAAYGERRFTGEVRSIDSRVDPVTRSVMVRVLLDNAEGLLKPGLLMQVTLRKNPRETLVIPEGALMPVGRDQFVLVAVPAGDGHQAQRRAVRIGSRRAGEVEVLEGLAAGELVITHGTLRARPGQPVVVQAVDDGSRSLAELLKDGGTEAVQ